MAHNGGTGPPPPLRLGPPVQTARLLPRNANILLPQLQSLHPSSQSHRASTTTTTTANSSVAVSGGGDSRNVITLDQPRPGVARVRNEYIETPLRTQLPPSLAAPILANSNKGSSTTTTKDHQLDEQTNRTSGGVGTSSAASLAEVHHHTTLNYNRDNYHHRPSPINHLLLQPSPPHHDGRPQTLQSPPPHSASQRLNQQQHNTQVLAMAKLQPVVSQPCSTLKKHNSFTTTKRDGVSPGDCVGEEGVTLSGVKGVEDPHIRGESIFCRKCGLCRCDACRSTRPLPSTWICADSYQCSAETTLDQCTCMCCVKALFYHCCKDYEMDSREVSCADKPCSCAPHHRWIRWGSLCLLTAVLPCLLCYWPMRACLKLCEACHTRFTSHGCRCPSTTTTNTTTTPTSKLSSPLGGDNDDDLNASYRRKSNALHTNTQHAKRLLDPTV